MSMSVLFNLRKIGNRSPSLSRSLPSSARGVTTSVNCVDATKVAVVTSKFGLGAFARHEIKEGEIVEYGEARRLPVDGQSWDMVFTWSPNRDVWATCTGASIFYNMSLQPNTNMTRLFDEDKFFITATRDIKQGEALTHTYKSLQWRKVFSALPQPGADEAKDEELDIYKELPDSLVMHDKVQVDIRNGESVCIAKESIRQSEVVERGVFRIAPLPKDVKSAALFHVGNEVATASGLLMMYDNASPTVANLQVIHDNANFTVRALRDIEKGETLSLRANDLKRTDRE